MWKNIAAILAGAAAAALQAFNGALAGADASAVTGSDPFRLVLFGLAVALVTRAVNWAIAKLA